VNISEINFQDILSDYFYGTGALSATETLLNAITKCKKAWMKRMLRHHGEWPVSDSYEIQFRDAVDDLIVCYNVLEVAITGGLILQPENNSQFWNDARVILENEFVRYYYVNLYPERLPQLLLLRLQCKFGYIEDGPTRVLVMSFFDLDRQFIQNHRGRYLLKMLDDFTIAGYRFLDVSSLLESPEKFIKSLLKNPDEKSILDEAVHELDLFLEFCFKLYDMILRSEPWPLLQSEIWLRYSYWFDIIGVQLNHHLGKALDKFLTWPPLSADQNLSEIQNYVDRARRTLKYLLSAKYTSYADKMLKSFR
jgi:hypothetical protein